ncbi:ATP-binding protein [Massilibacteroides sp.]|uniref:sensor histidine kinase n=1 Tax=Massilibacteroides sp. TaxID=2034766 RepID=UPI002613BA2D|nr:ATP-binding protein [Massilibacteroides sp.]MDD4515169.1 ATP-binding protein [Massilibacteroides sp.]
MSQLPPKQPRRISFSLRLFWSVFAIFLAFITCFLIFQYQREREFAQEKLNIVLTNYNHQLYYRLAQSDDIKQTIEGFTVEIPQHDIRVTIISPDGKVIFDNSGVEHLDNHNNRTEVRKARSNNEGYSIRSSGSTGKRYFYSASNINNFIYRTALPYDMYVKDVLTINKDFIYFMLLMTLLFFVVLSRFTFSIGKTISKLRDFALNVDLNRIPEVRYTFPDDELGDISQNIITLYQQQQKAKDEVSMEREKLIKHFQYSKEGFAMFTADGKEILSNNLFIQYLNLISDNRIDQTEEALQIEELKPILYFLNSNIHNPNRKKQVLPEPVTIDKEGKIFQIECLLFLDNTYELSINDISRQEEETRMKRQLTQNIAHELKTPVSSIQGYLETIISNPELSEEKKRFFIERCYSQSSRLTDLLRDISVLNRLDEASDMFELSDINIGRLINEIQKECSKEMDEKRITSEIILPGDPSVHGNYSLLYSIFRNLFDNAIAYSGEGVLITVNCYREDSKFYYFSFSDNGVGIDEEHINRIFERFYRVDKGRSRKIGGTGLGLSIVKNGVNFHKGHIYAKSSLGKGVTFFFTIKKKI